MLKDSSKIKYLSFTLLKKNRQILMPLNSNLVYNSSLRFNCLIKLNLKLSTVTFYRWVTPKLFLGYSLLCSRYLLKY